MQRAARAALWIAFVLSTAWFVLLTAVALLMSTGLADEPGDTNGLKRFATFFALGVPGLVGCVICARFLRPRKLEQSTGGFDVPLKSAAPAPRSVDDQSATDHV